MIEYREQILQAAEFIRKRIDRPLHVGIVLGTGLGPLADEIDRAVVIPYGDIPHFPDSTVKFHAGRLVLGELSGKMVMAMQGRFHYYEGHSMRAITLPIRVMFQLSIRTLILTNAAGGIRERMIPGTFALVTDHINLMGDNPLIGPYDEFMGERFPDMSHPYSPELQQIARKAADELGVPLLDSIYAAVSGPSFETAAEIRMLQKMDADTVGMSVVPEVLAARQLGMDVLAITVVTDQALPDHMEPVSHEQVQKVADRVGADFRRLLKRIIRNLPDQKQGS